MPRRYPEHPGWVGGDELSDNGGDLCMGLTRLFWLGSANARDGPIEPHAQNTTILAQFVATYRTRATLISP